MKKRTTLLLPVLFSALLFLCGFEVGGGQLVISQIAGEYNAGEIGIGLIVFVQYLAAVLMPITFGSLADRVGKKRILLIFIALFSLGSLLVWRGNALWSLIVGIFLIGSGYSVSESVSSAILTDTYGAQSSRYINLIECALSIGAMVAPLILPRLEQRSWRTLFAILCVGALVVLLPLIPVPVVKKESEGTKLSLRSVTGLFRLPIFALLFGAIILYVGLENGFGYFVESLFADRLGSADFGAYAIFAYWLGMAVSRVICAMDKGSPYRLLLLCFGVITALFIALSCTASATAALILSGLIGFAYGPVWGDLMSLATRLRSEESATAAGVMSTGCGLGGAFFPILMGAVAQTMDIRFAFFLLAATAAAGGVLCFFAARRAKKA